MLGQQKHQYRIQCMHQQASYLVSPRVQTSPISIQRKTHHRQLARTARITLSGLPQAGGTQLFDLHVGIGNYVVIIVE
ncbi:hypothetical protein AU05_09465 [Ectopseudomonas composti]|uniref:Uncharacterized protein n=1 Tax=Ectopseudomonas composti TaxID=658457 RepID=A0ABN0SDQ4_9GAMM|nr:hypothetical protein AU05_09465 [Pseudomonas composti]